MPWLTRKSDSKMADEMAQLKRRLDLIEGLLRLSPVIMNGMSTSDFYRAHQSWVDAVHATLGAHVSHETWRAASLRQEAEHRRGAAFEASRCDRKDDDHD